MPSSPRPRLLVTRPADRQEPFGTRARALGVDTVAFPCLEIRPDPDARLPDASTLAGLDAVLFTSRPAVEAADRLRPLPWPGVAALAIGTATAEALTRAGQALRRAPVPPFTSEALLAVLEDAPPLARLLVVKGHGGRDVLERRLADRGSRVESVALYRRARPAADEHRRRRALVESPPDIVSSTSDEALRNLVILAADAHATLHRTPLIVNSARAAQGARSMGFGGELLIADPAGDAGQLEALAAWLQRREGAGP